MGGERARWERQEGKWKRERPILTRGARDVGCEVTVPEGHAAGVGVTVQRGRHLCQQAQEDAAVEAHRGGRRVHLRRGVRGIGMRVEWVGGCEGLRPEEGA